jgi:LytS/YehU family sensor histidine kinase
MVSKLSNFLRYSLDNDPMQKVDLDHEINTMKLYMEIEKVRFEERLNVKFDIQEAARKALVPSLILQPLVENSLKYAIADRETGGTISIRARVFAGDLLLEVEDDGPGIEIENGKFPEFKGVGIVNTRERLEELYGERHSCRFTGVLPHGLKIEIRIPFETDK